MSSKHARTGKIDLENGIDFVDRYRAVEVDEANNELLAVRKTLDKLKEWHNWEVKRRRSLKSSLLSACGSNRPPCPPVHELTRLALYFFPPRPSIKVEICDLGDGRFERCSATIENLENCQCKSNPHSY